MAKLFLNLNNIGDNGEDKSNILELSLTMLDIRKIPLKELLKAQELTTQHIPQEDIEEFYDQLRSFKFKIKSLIPTLIDFKFDKLADLLILFKVIDEEFLEELYQSELVNDNCISIEIIPYEYKILIEESEDN